MKNSYLLLLVSSVIISCPSSNDEAEIVQIKYGTSFGECIGYCQRDLTIGPGLITFRESSWIDTLESIMHTDAITSTDWNELRSSINVYSLLALPDVIGCPDCSDGGAEWLEVELSNGAIHKVIFEYNNEPHALKGCIPKFRELMFYYYDKTIS